MPVLIWDNPENRVYESGLDRGVLYLSDGSAVPWNGLISVVEKPDNEMSVIYFDGMKISTPVVVGDFSGTLKALTYPDEFSKLEGIGKLRAGVFLGDQVPQSFNLCYRVCVGDDLTGDTVGYKIHVLYNVTAIPNEKTYASISNDPNLVEFEWDISAIPEENPGFRPSAHFIIDTRELDPWLLEDLEAMLYGDQSNFASLPSLKDLFDFVNLWYRVKITDNGDGTWTATSKREGFINILDTDTGLFEIVNINAVYLNDYTFEISDTTDVSEVPEIRIVDNGDGTWSAITDQGDLIVMTDPGTFEILNANAVFIGTDSYVISDTIEG